VTFDFDLESYFRTISIQAVYFEWLDLATLSSVIFTISRSWFSSKVMGEGEGHGSEKAVAYNSKTTGLKLLGLDDNSCYDNAQNNSAVLAF